MQGYLLQFFFTQDQRYGHQMLADWLLNEIRSLGLSGATLAVAEQGFGGHGPLHSAHFFELGDQPQQIYVAASCAEGDLLLQHLMQTGVKLFYVKSAIEFGQLGVQP
ncbi:MAG: DUF190 domain-containing protein [Pseudomonadales bacterium]|nr:DUF190 domain-containing protein [Pseudomonadales bacterium]